MDALEAIRQTYFQECDELLLAMEEGLIAMDAGNADSETINAVFRAVHSIKGGGGAFNFDRLVVFAHEFETVLDLVRDGRLQATAEVVKILLRAGDILSDHVNAVRNRIALAEDAGSEIVAALLQLSNSKSGSTVQEDFADIGVIPIAATADETLADTGWTISFKPYASLYRNANDPLFIFRELSGLGQLTATADFSRLPQLEALDPDEAYVAWTLELRSTAQESDVAMAFDFVADDCALTIAPLTPPASPDMAQQALSITELDSAPSPLPESTVVPIFAAKREEQATVTAAAVTEKSADTVVKTAIRIDTDKVDRVVNLVGELVITQAMLDARVREAVGNNSPSSLSALTELEQLLRELQESVMAIRTQPVKSVFQRMPRLVREVAAQTGKLVNLELEGEATEVDKTVIDRLGEPLTHMIRNAIDHGLETPEARLAAGKKEEGRVRLSAAHRAGRIVIELSDDGRGIDRDRVRQKAIESGLIAPDALLSEEETDNLIFLPGFSTANDVSNISGRGVGMDVVRRSVAELGGRIAIATMPGQGSRFSLTLPLTLAVLDGMIVAVGDQYFVLPLSHIIESLRPHADEIRSFGRDRTLLRVRDSYIPLVRISELLGVGEARGVTDGVVMVVESEGNGQLALAVDDIIGQKQVVIKSFEGNYNRIEGIAGATILGDGRVALILDIHGLVALCRDETVRTGTA